MKGGRKGHNESLIQWQQAVLLQGQNLDLVRRLTQWKDTEKGMREEALRSEKRQGKEIESDRYGPKLKVKRLWG